MLGLGGRSTVSLVGGMACAVPAVMAARALPDRRERLLTILVTPLMTCSARLPVYAFLIAFVVPDGTWLGMNRQGLFLYGLYLASTAATLLMAWLLHKSLPQDRERLEHAEEWPPYRIPRLSQVAGNMVRQGSVFVRSAGQVILVLSVVLWGLGFVGQGSLAERQAMEPAQRLETSVLGAVGDAIEPIVTPLGYDGRLGIAVLSSFAAREASWALSKPSTLHQTVRPPGQRTQGTAGPETHPRTGLPLLTTASAASLIVFYMFAMAMLEHGGHRPVRTQQLALGAGTSCDPDPTRLRTCVDHPRDFGLNGVTPLGRCRQPYAPKGGQPPLCELTGSCHKCRSPWAHWRATRDGLPPWIRCSIPSERETKPLLAC